MFGKRISFIFMIFSFRVAFPFNTLPKDLSFIQQQPWNYVRGSFGVDPVGVSVTVSCLMMSHEPVVDFNQICMEITLVHDEELIRF